jgi:hypothetical protein
MPYPYGPRGAPSVGNALPGLPRRDIVTIGADPAAFPAAFMTVRIDQNIRIPAWATYARVSATGKGGVGFRTGNRPPGGGGGGFSGTLVERAPPGAVISVRFDDLAVIVDALGYRLSAGTGSNGTSTAGGIGGIGQGGAVNFNGGNGSTITSDVLGGAGGGAASRGGNGGNASSNGTPGSGGPGFEHLTGGTPGGFGSSSAQAPQMPAAAPFSNQIGGAAIRVGMNSVPSNDLSAPDGGAGSGGAQGSNPGANPSGAGFVLIEFW